MACFVWLFFSSRFIDFDRKCKFEFLYNSDLQKISANLDTATNVTVVNIDMGDIMAYCINIAYISDTGFMSVLYHNCADKSYVLVASNLWQTR